MQGCGEESPFPQPRSTTRPAGRLVINATRSWNGCSRSERKRSYCAGFQVSRGFTSRGRSEARVADIGRQDSVAPVRSRLWTGLAIGAALSVVSGCSATPKPTTTPLPTVEPTLATLALPAPPPLSLPAVAPLVFKACAGSPGMQCSTMTVPLDYADPSGPTIAIAVARLPAFSAHPAGSIVVNPGGPGESGIDYLEQAAGRFATLRATYDIVSFDPRGDGTQRARAMSGAVRSRCVLRARPPRYVRGQSAGDRRALATLRGRMPGEEAAAGCCSSGPIRGP